MKLVRPSRLAPFGKHQLRVFASPDGIIPPQPEDATGEFPLSCGVAQLAGVAVLPHQRRLNISCSDRRWRCKHGSQARELRRRILPARRIAARTTGIPARFGG